MKSQGESYILWLPSWYPNKFQPYEGDFIQRHAKAASIYNNIIVIAFPQFGEASEIDYCVEKKIYQNLEELTIYIPYKPLHIPILDKVIYNLKYYRVAKKFLKQFFYERGLPVLVHTHVPIKAGNLALWIKKKFRIPYILSEQASTYLQTAPDNFHKRHSLYKKQVTKIFREAFTITNVSRAVGDILESQFKIKKLVVIHNVVDTTLFNEVSQKFDVFTFIHVSSLSDQKNIYGILRSFTALSKIRKDWRLIIVGPFTLEIENYIKKSDLNVYVHLIGEVSNKEVADYVKQSHVFVLFSKHENFPCVIVEALCCGLPVVSSDVAGVKEAVNVSNGILTDSENESSLLAALLKIIQSYPAYDCVSIATNAKKRFGFPAIARQFADLYKSVGVGQ